MGLHVNETATITLEPTLAGEPGAIDVIKSYIVEPAGVLGDITWSADNLSGTALVLSKADATITVVSDVVKDGDGEIISTATFSTLDAIPEPVVLADAVAVSVQ